MLVYGDAARLADPREELKALGAALCGLQAPSLPIERHAWLASLFIAVSELAQGLADAALDQTGVDGPTPDQDQATALLMILAAALLESWKSLGEGGGLGRHPAGASHDLGRRRLSRVSGADAAAPDRAPEERGGLRLLCALP